MSKLKTMYKEEKGRLALEAQTRSMEGYYGWRMASSQLIFGRATAIQDSRLDRQESLLGASRAGITECSRSDGEETLCEECVSRSL